MGDKSKKQVFKERLRPTFFVMLVWSLFFGFAAVACAVIGIMESSDLWIVAIPSGIMMAIGLVFFMPMLIQRKKIVFEEGKIVAHTIPKKLHDRLSRLWRTKGIIDLLPRRTVHFEGRVIPLSWKRGWQTIDLARIDRAAEWVVSLRPQTFTMTNTKNLRKNSIVLNTLVEYLILADSHLLDLTGFKYEHQLTIIKLIEERANASWAERKPISTREFRQQR
jgi:hypothetical protein